jgi:hypothetical protein
MEKMRISTFRLCLILRSEGVKVVVGLWLWLRVNMEGGMGFERGIFDFIVCMRSGEGYEYVCWWKARRKKNEKGKKEIGK